MARLFFTSSIFLVFTFVNLAQADLVAHWKLDGDVNDSTGTHDGIIQGDAHFVQGVWGSGALSLDGSGDYVCFPSAEMAQVNAFG